jgi:hypothetical protein
MIKDSLKHRLPNFAAASSTIYITSSPLHAASLSLSTLEFLEELTGGVF